ncbi:MAG: TolC family protein [Bacteroidaceae bacterium]|nr:TolC family protein [Bacteroidaceae bacterium]
MKIRNIIAATAIALTACTLQAQESNTLKACLEQGLKNIYSLRIIRNKEAIADNNATWANAGMLPTANLSGGYSGTLDNSDATAREDGSVAKQRNITDHTLRAGLDFQWTLFNGFKMQADYNRLKELKLQSETETRLAVEDFIAKFTAEYYNFVQQRARMRNLNHAVKLSRERLRIVHARYLIGNNSRLDLLQARVDFNADSAESVKQNERLSTSRIRLQELMAERNMDKLFAVADTLVDVSRPLNFDKLWESTQKNNASLLLAAQDKKLAEIELKKIRSRDYPYLNLNAGYGYTHNKYEVGTIDKRKDWGADFGLTLGFKLFDGNRSRERRNAKLAIKNAELEQQDLELSLYADLSDLWQAYENNSRLLALERQNVFAARENYAIAHERYLLGDLSGIEMREAQKSLLDAEDRILVVEYNTKLCEISLLQLSGDIMVYLE